MAVDRSGFCEVHQLGRPNSADLDPEELTEKGGRAFVEVGPVVVVELVVVDQGIDGISQVPVGSLTFWNAGVRPERPERCLLRLRGAKPWPFPIFELSLVGLLSDELDEVSLGQPAVGGSPRL